MDKCSKCWTEDTIIYKYSDLEHTWGLCRLCNRAYDDPHTWLMEFLKDDFGCCPISPITKKMINARKKRAQGNDPWASKKTT